MSSHAPVGKSLLSLYRQLLRKAATYPSRNRMEIYQSIREEFRENVSLDPFDDKTKRKVQLAQQGLNQLRQFEEKFMSGGKSGDSSWTVTMEQNPMPVPPNYERK